MIVILLYQRIGMVLLTMHLLSCWDISLTPEQHVTFRHYSSRCKQCLRLHRKAIDFSLLALWVSSDRIKLERILQVNLASRSMASFSL